MAKASARGILPVLATTRAQKSIRLARVLEVIVQVYACFGWVTIARKVHFAGGRRYY